MLISTPPLLQLPPLAARAREATPGGEQVVCPSRANALQWSNVRVRARVYDPDPGRATPLPRNTNGVRDKLSGKPPLFRARARKMTAGVHASACASRRPGGAPAPHRASQTHGETPAPATLVRTAQTVGAPVCHAASAPFPPRGRFPGWLFRMFRWHARRCHHARFFIEATAFGGRGAAQRRHSTAGCAGRSACR